MKIGDLVQCRAWQGFGRIVALPESITPLSYITIIREGETREVNVWLPSIITNEEDFLYDWGE